MASDAPVWAIVPAAGSGRRMGGDLPKQYQAFAGKTILEHCLDRLLSHPAIDGAILVLSDNDSHWDSLDYQPGKPLFTTTGGSERMHSVYSGLTTLQYRCGNEVIALVHDAARPLVRQHDLDAVITAARAHALGAILACPVNDTLKRQGEGMEIDSTVPREGLWRALTPQVFHLQALLNALKAAIDQDLMVTDEAQAVELAGFSPALVEGSADNIKITTPDDLWLAETIQLHHRDE